MKLFSIKIVAALALLRTNEVAFAGFLKGSAQVQSDVNGSRCADPCLTATCNSPKKPYCQPDNEGCGYSCVADCGVCNGVTCFVGTCVPNAECSGFTCAGVTDEEGKDVKVQSDTGESEGCSFLPGHDPCIDSRNGKAVCKGNTPVCVISATCSMTCEQEGYTPPTEPAPYTKAAESVFGEEEEEDDVKVQSDTDESEGCRVSGDPCEGDTSCNGPRHCVFNYSTCTKSCEKNVEEEEEEDVKVQSDADESEGCFVDPCPNVQCNGPRHCEYNQDCSTKCVKNVEEEEEEDDVKTELLLMQE